MSYENITTETSGNVLTVTLDRPDTGNALDTPMLEDLTDAFEAAGRDDGVRAVVLAANGNVFVAGSDLDEMKSYDPASYIGYLDSFHGTMNTIRDADVPVVAAVDGPAYGGGNILVGATDLAVAAESASFGQQEINVGIVGGAELVRDLPRKVVNEIVMLGEPFSADRARELGLINRVVPDGDVHDAVADLADDLAEKPQVALAVGKRAIRAAEDAGPLGTETMEAFGLSLCFGTDDQVEGMEAFLESREPEFTDTIG
ncbi:enoyl-CoA hydratase/isomerase family protein [Natrinema sp. 1APR25-10V2]|uniref:enoyl-CoA hydratase/isomerase family protein n=1 Tax=Natrinema sp. 1APR25-10V2 TaxID=2951081 RepID=UPI002875BC76|nr:enoyl-CoA hydratase/isomerase family protein [Natrinema sp. 1APR25-10V2]MDS0478663.1 enoyl-CoA hydratase/isomerase family protein [Natrinema sp. 1APR25-10V2]